MTYSRIIRSLSFPAITLFAISCKTNQGGGDPYANNNPYYGPQGAYGDTAAVEPVPDSSGYVAPAPAEPNYSAPPSAPSRPSGGGGGGGGGRTHTVASGDTLYGLARRNGTSVKAIKNANGLSSDVIRIGQKLKIP